MGRKDEARIPLYLCILPFPCFEHTHPRASWTCTAEVDIWVVVAVVAIGRRALLHTYTEFERRAVPALQTEGAWRTGEADRQADRRGSRIGRWMDGGIGRDCRRFRRYSLVAEVVGVVVPVAAALRFSGETGVCIRSLLVILTPSETESRGCC